MLLWLGLLIISMSLSQCFTGTQILFGEHATGSREAAEPVPNTGKYSYEINPCQ